MLLPTPNLRASEREALRQLFISGAHGAYVQQLRAELHAATAAGAGSASRLANELRDLLAAIDVLVQTP